MFGMVCVLLATSQAHTEEAPSQEAAQAKLNAVVERLNALTTWFDDADRKLAGWQTEIAGADREIAAVGREIRDLVQQLRDLQASVKALEAERRRLTANSNRQATMVAAHLRSAYRISGQDFLKSVLSESNPDQFDRMLRYHEYFTEARMETLAEYRQTLTAIEANARERRAREEELQANRNGLATREQALLAGRERRKGLVVSLTQEMTANDSLRAKLKRDHIRLDALVSEIKDSVKHITRSTFATNKGLLPWPVEGELVHGYRQPRDGGRTRWQGVFLEAPPGTPVRAVASGRVVFAEWLRGWGFLTIVDHGDDNMTLYGYADTLLKDVGDWVEGGENVAAAGGSGGQARDGLYFEVRAGGKPSNPLQWLAPR